MMEGTGVIFDIIIRTMWFWLPVLVLLGMADTKLGKKVSDKIDKLM